MHNNFDFEIFLISQLSSYPKTPNCILKNVNKVLGIKLVNVTGALT